MAFESLTDRLAGVFKKLRGHGKLTEADIKAAMREVRMALLEADVNYKVAKDFCAKVSERAMGQEVMESLTPAQQVIKIVDEELTKLMGGGQAFHHFLAHGALRNLRAEILCDFVVDVRFKQRHADFPHRSLDIRFTQLAFAAQFFENAVQTLA